MALRLVTENDCHVPTTPRAAAEEAEVLAAALVAVRRAAGCPSLSLSVQHALAATSEFLELQSTSPTAGEEAAGDEDVILATALIAVRHAAGCRSISEHGQMALRAVESLLSRYSAPVRAFHEGKGG
jgi:hypothetical protein